MRELKEDRIYEFSNFIAEETGLTSGTIWVSTEKKGKFPRIKFFRGKDATDDTVSVKISKPPEVNMKVSSFKLSPKEKKEIFAFIEINYDTLLFYWKEGVGMNNTTRRDWEDGIKSIKSRKKNKEDLVKGK